jgi:hypothetical protein
MTRTRSPRQPVGWPLRLLRSLGAAAALALAVVGKSIADHNHHVNSLMTGFIMLTILFGVIIFLVWTAIHRATRPREVWNGVEHVERGRDHYADHR